jgi:hypothetical protein
MIEIAVAGKFAYAVIPLPASDFHTLAVIDCSNLTAPRIVKTAPRAGRAIAIEGNYLYSTDYGVRVFDISDPLNPTQVGLLNSLGTGTAIDIAVRGKYVYLAGWSLGFCVIDVSDPTKPWLVGRESGFAPIPPLRVALAGNYAYISDLNGALHVLNIERRGRPERVGGNLQVNVASLFASNDTLYVGERAGGLTILDLFRPNARSLRLTALEPILEGVARVRATAPAGETVQIEKLENGVWTPWKPLTAANSPIDLADPQASSTIQIYRIAKP